MYCKNCGSQILDNTAFCKFCGVENLVLNNKLGDEGVNSPTIGNGHETLHSGEDDLENVSLDIAEQNRIIKKNKIFHNEDEALIDILGGGFISSLVVQKSFRKSVLICSDKRIYQKGKLFTRNSQGRISYYHGEKFVDLREITGIGQYVDDPIYRLRMMGTSFALGIIGFFLSAELHGNIKDIITLISGVFIGTGILSLIMYGLKRGKWFEIEYAGGKIISNCNWYSKKSIKRFMKNISIQRDRLFNS